MSLLDVDAAVASAELIAAKGGWRDRLAIWIVADHGHAPVSQHDDLHAFIESTGYRVLAHPKLRVRKPDVALMVGGNAMAHVYLEPEHRTRGWWPTLRSRWESLHDLLVQRPSVDLAAVAISQTRVRITSASAGSAEILRDTASTFSYRPLDGDPLGVGGTHNSLSESEAWELTRNTAHPDSIVQLATLAPAARSGDIVLSAAPNWDLRERFESVTHVSTHGALLRDQMLVPFLVDRPMAVAPRRTVDVMTGALELLGIATDMQSRK